MVDDNGVKNHGSWERSLRVIFKDCILTNHSRTKNTIRICRNFYKIQTCTHDNAILSNALLSRDGALTKALVKMINDDEIAWREGEGEEGEEGEDRAIQPRTPLRGFINCHRRVICSPARAREKDGNLVDRARSTYLIAAFIRTVMSRSFNEAAVRHCSEIAPRWFIVERPRISTLSPRSTCTLRLYEEKKYLFSLFLFLQFNIFVQHTISISISFSGPFPLWILWIRWQLLIHTDYTDAYFFLVIFL